MGKRPFGPPTSHLPAPSLGLCVHLCTVWPEMKPGDCVSVCGLAMRGSGGWGCGSSLGVNVSCMCVCVCLEWWGLPEACGLVCLGHGPGDGPGQDHMVSDCGGVFWAAFRAQSCMIFLCR